MMCMEEVAMSFVKVWIWTCLKISIIKSAWISVRHGTVISISLSEMKRLVKPSDFPKGLSCLLIKIRYWKAICRS